MLKIYCKDAIICLSSSLSLSAVTNTLISLHEAMRQHAQYSNNYIATSPLLLKTNKG